MSTNHTPHFNLSQWEPGDQVVRTEFNENHAKIEHALLNHCSAELIASVTAEEETARLELDISNVNWSRYMMAFLLIDAGTDGEMSLSLYGNQEFCHYFTSGTMSTTTKLISLRNVNHMAALFPIFYDGTRRPSVISFGSGTTNYCHLSAGGGQKPLNQSDILSVTRISERFLASDRAELWGVK